MRVGLFPGQGVPADVVVRGLSDGDPLLDTANEVLGYDLRARLGSYAERGAELPTCVAQPAMFVASLQSWSRDRGDGRRFDYLVGHSLGEYPALVAAGAVSARDALEGVKVRAEATDETARAMDGGMAAVLKLDLRQVEAISAATGVSIANDNAPGQVVVAGDRGRMTEAAQAVAEAGARWKELEVAAPFHTEAMAPNAPTLEAQLDRIDFSSPEIPVISNVTARPYEDPDRIKQLLVRQLTSRVRFRESLEWLWAQGVREFEDIGPGEVVGGLARRAFRSLESGHGGDGSPKAGDAAAVPAAPETHDLHHTIPTRVIVSPCSGRFRPLPDHEALSDGEWVEPGQVVAGVDAGEETVPVESAFRGWVAGGLVFDRQPIVQGQALFWGRAQ